MVNLADEATKHMCWRVGNYSPIIMKFGRDYSVPKIVEIKEIKINVKEK